ncbi:redoxin domain-containing protein [Rasiella sp. SM2506]|uniref:redoxin domain-containing protein n=1 Tax=Rasiella sp. SM2506 TaxID=3423914 RepID=UPI003D7ABB2F
MKLLVYILTTIVLFLVATSCKEAPSAVPDSRKSDYALYDANGGFHRFSWYNNKKAIVLWVQGNGCPIVRNGLTDFTSIAKNYSEKGFQFFMINSNTQDDRAEIASEAKEFNFTTPVLVDNTQLVADALNITITAEVIVLHPTTREIVYRGPINNRLDYEVQKDLASETYLKDALDAILDGQAIVNKKEITRGCTVTRLSTIEKDFIFNYSDHIAPILANNCVQCHREGGRAPWVMEDYQTIVGWSGMIKEVLLSKRMPPWKADPTIGDFKHDFSLADSNARKIIRWIEQGMPPGTGKDTLQTLVFPPVTWERGTPDKVILLKEQTIPASKKIAYQYQTFELDLTEDTWLRGVEIIPGNPKVLHHIVLTHENGYTSSPITSRELRPFTDNFIALGAGANQSTFFPENTGVFLKKGEKLKIQLHYTPIGKEAKDQTKIGFYYHKEKPEKWFYPLSPTNITFTIPPNTKDVKIVAQDTIQRDIYIHSLMPHMHYRGKSIKISVITPDGGSIPLVSVPDFNMDWQWLYELKEPIFAPKGSVIFVEGVFDNTVQNPMNPDASKEIRFGIQSTDEMLTGFFNYTLAD